MHEIRKGELLLTDLYAVIIDDIAIVADLHIGYEGVLRREGAMIPKYQKEILKKRLNNIIEKYEPSLLIINGDFKHEFGKNLWQEWYEVTEILDFLTKKTKVLLIRGNHDNFLKTIAKKFDVPLLDEFEYNKIKIAHGHKEVEGEKVIIGHEHPSLHLRDKVGAFVKLPCFLYSEKLIVLPALSPLATGTDVSSPEQYLSPLLKKIADDEMEVYAISDELLYFSSLEKLKKVL